MKETKQKGSKWKVFKKLFAYVGLPLFIFVLIYGWYFTYNLPDTVSNLIKEELDKYDFGEYSIEAIAVRHDKAVLGPISFGKDEDQLKVAQVQLNYSLEGIQNGEVESITVSGADLHLNRQGQWQLAGLEGILRGIANYQKANPSDEKSQIPLINVETSLLTLHYQQRQYSFPLSIAISEKNENIIFEVQTNLSRDHLQTFTFVLDPENLSLDLKLDSFNLDITQAGHFLQEFGMRDSKGSISARNISLALSPERFDIGGEVQIQNFKTIYKDEGKPVTLTFDKVGPVTISRNLKDAKAIFEDTIHFHNLAYSYGTYLFKADEIKSKVYFDINADIYKTDSMMKNASGQLDGSKLNSQSEIGLKLNWERGELQNYSTKGQIDFSYSGGIVKGSTNIDINGLGEDFEAKGDFADWQIPEGSIQGGFFTYKQLGTKLELDVKVKSLALLSGNVKGDSSFVYKKENDLVDISGTLNNLTLFEHFTGNAEVTVQESKNELKSSLKNFSFKTTEGDFELVFDADLTLPVTFDDLTNKPLKSTFTASSSVSRLKISDYIIKPFALEAKGKPEAFSFSVNKLEPDQLSFMTLTSLSGSLDLNKKQFDANFETQLDFETLIPALKGKIEPISVGLKITEDEGILDLQLNDKLPESFISYKDNTKIFKAAIKHESHIQAAIPLSNLLQSKLSSFKSLTHINIKDLKTDQLEIDETSTVLKLTTDESVGLDNYLDLRLQGDLNNFINSIKFGLKKATKKEMTDLQIPKWKEGLIAKSISSELPFKWSVRKGFNDTSQAIKVGSLSHSRWVDGGDFLGYFAKEVTIEKLNLTGIFKGLQMKMKEDIQLNESLSVNLQLDAGWDIPEAILSGSQSPIPFLLEVALLPEHSFKSSGSLKMGDTEMTELALFVKEPISEDNILKGTISAEVNFYKDEQGFKVPAVVEIKNTRGYFVDENGNYIKMKGLRGKLKLESLLDLRSEDSQYLRVDSFESPSLKLENTVIKYKMYSPEKVRIMRLNTNWCGGQVEGADILFNPAHQSLKCSIHASKVEMEKVMGLMKGVKCKANGSLYGRLTLELRNGKVINQDGFLFSEPGTKMNLQMQTDNVIYNSITDKKTKKILSNLDVEYFKILFLGEEDMDKHKTVFNLKGTSAVGDPPNVLDLSINFNGPVIYYLQLPLHEKAIKEFIEKKVKEKK